jgi:rhodanese-related sulfurtransferase
MWHTVQRALLLVVFGVLLGLLSNGLSSKGIPLITPPKKAPKADEFVPLNKAHELWSGGNSFFLDARKPADFEAGHIANALNLPVEEFGEHFPKLAPMLSPESPIVVYCDGEQCELSHRLADLMRQQGYTNVHMLHNGWTAWNKAGYPVEAGAK